MSKVKAVIEGKSGKIYFSQEAESMKKGLTIINDFLNDNSLKESYVDYFVDFLGNKTSVSEYTLVHKPVDNDEREWENMEIATTGNVLPNNS